MSWDGWGPGMSGPVIAAVKRELRRRFSYGAQLDDTEAWTDELTTALVKYQGIVHAEVASGKRQPPDVRTDGRIDWGTQVQLDLVKQAQPADRPVGTLFTVQGTGVDMWTGPPADTARAVLPDWRWQPIGNYPAAPFPMWPSAWQGIEELRLQIRDHANRFPGQPMALAGFSQGAIVTSWVYKWDIELPQGMLHDLLPLFKAAVTWGNPMRELGAANGNRAAGWPVPEGRGIYKDRLEQTPDWWFDYAHGANSQWDRDLYTDSPNNHTGDLETAVCDIVMMADPLSAFNLMFGHIGHLFDDPATEIPPMFDAIVHAGMFFIVQGTTPHLNYDINPAIDYLRGVAASIRAGKTRTAA